MCTFLLFPCQRCVSFRQANAFLLLTFNCSGACGQWTPPADFVVALNRPQFGQGYPAANCFKTITMNYNGKTATAKIVDECPECPWGALDLSRSLFTYFAPEEVGIIYGSWHLNGPPSQGPLISTGLHHPVLTMPNSNSKAAAPPPKKAPQNK
ncbi:hypothetical protein CPB83DRAFT_757582 [Crepidotus variabilis]|uniref:RlpA-like double-psi beta-barrel-protein domain-containing protein-containing protein n=1 Tax=Crepidotus variabilis TaxID=179855 RepID=A0A9P6JUI1_9AGAR|nr:hypothetical protein CPB83DRAFT_757582 [Crepidotus variabilis]